MCVVYVAMQLFDVVYILQLLDLNHTTFQFICTLSWNIIGELLRPSMFSLTILFLTSRSRSDQTRMWIVKITIFIVIK